jgi:hypothetical protein
VTSRDVQKVTDMQLKMFSYYSGCQQCFAIWLNKDSLFLKKNLILHIAAVFFYLTHYMLFHYWFVMGMVSSEVVFWHKATSPATHATNINQSGFASSWWSCTDACLDEGLMLRCRWNLEYTGVDAQLSKPDICDGCLGL